jgi:hypothetical protein
MASNKRTAQGVPWLWKNWATAQIDLRQTRLFTDLVGKVHEQRTRRCHYQQACQERGAQPSARVTQSVVQEG